MRYNNRKRKRGRMMDERFLFRGKRLENVRRGFNLVGNGNDFEIIGNILRKNIQKESEM